MHDVEISVYGALNNIAADHLIDLAIMGGSAAGQAAVHRSRFA